MNELLYLLPLIGAMIGWLTNWVAVKMLFHPKEPIRLWLVTFHGIFPKRQAAFAQKLGVLVATELFSVEEVTAKLREKALSEEVMELIRSRIKKALDNKLQEHFPVIGMFVSDQKINKIANEFTNEVRDMIGQATDRISKGIEAEMDVETIVRDKVANFSSDKLEEILFAIMKREFRFVEIVGGVLGFLIGSIQLLITQFAE